MARVQQRLSGAVAHFVFRRPSNSCSPSSSGSGAGAAGSDKGGTGGSWVAGLRDQPVLVNTIGRTGSSLVLRLLAEHSRILAYRPRAREVKLASYWADIFLALAEPRSYQQPISSMLRGAPWWLADARPFDETSTTILSSSSGLAATTSSASPTSVETASRLFTPALHPSAKAPATSPRSASPRRPHTQTFSGTCIRKPARSSWSGTSGTCCARFLPTTAARAKACSDERTSRRTRTMFAVSSAIRSISCTLLGWSVASGRTWCATRIYCRTRPLRSTPSSRISTSTGLPISWRRASYPSARRLEQRPHGTSAKEKRRSGAGAPNSTLAPGGL